MDSYHAAIHENLRFLTQMFPNLDMESRLQEDMFKKPNTRGMQSVFYSLMMILNSEYCQQQVPWPISHQSDNYKFRTSVVNFIKTECQDFEAPQLLPSLLNKAEGEKFIRLLFNFVTYVTKILIKRKNSTVLNVPNVAINEDEGARVFEVFTNTIDQRIHHERFSLTKQHSEFVRTSSQFINESDSEKKKLLKDIKQKKEKLARELQHILSYTKINEKKLVESALSDYETEAYEWRRNYLLTKQNIHHVLTKTEYLVRLINLLQNHKGDLISTEYLLAHVTNDLAKKINLPLTTILSTLFVHSENGRLINLKEFIRYGHLLLMSRQHKLLSLQKPDADQVVYHGANDILDNITKKANELKSLREVLGKIILDCEQKIPILESRCEQNTSSNEDWIETMRMVLSLNNYCPGLTNELPEESVLLDVPRVPPESNEDIMAKLQKIIYEMPSFEN